MKRSLLLLALLATSTVHLSATHATDPVPRSQSFPWMSLAQWYRLHAEDVEIAEDGNVDLLFLGDSITQGWSGEGKSAWEKSFGKYKTANFGIGGDTTSNVLWRLENGAVGKLSPKVIILMIGTNNFWVNSDEPEDVVEGIQAVLATLRQKLPDSKILLLEVFPRDESPKGPNRSKVGAVNKHLDAMADNQFIFVRDIGGIFLEPDGKISKSIMPDFLHLSAEGYARWAEAILPVIEPWFE